MHEPLHLEVHWNRNKERSDRHENFSENLEGCEKCREELFGTKGMTHVLN